MLSGGTQARRFLPVAAQVVATGLVASTRTRNNVLKRAVSPHVVDACSSVQLPPSSFVLPRILKEQNLAELT